MDQKQAQSSGENRTKKEALVVGDFHVDSSSSPFRLSTTNCSEDSSKFSSLISTDSGIKTAPEAAPMSSFKSRIKAAVQDKYLKSSTSVTKLIKFKQQPKSKENLSKFRSSSHGALHSLDDFGHVTTSNNNDDEDDFNGIWSASHLASRHRDSSKKTTITATSLQVMLNMSGLQITHSLCLAILATKENYHTILP